MQRETNVRHWPAGWKAIGFTAIGRRDTAGQNETSEELVSKGSVRHATPRPIGRGQCLAPRFDIHQSPDRWLKGPGGHTRAPHACEGWQ
jgi:hypothetical protein